MVKHVAKKTLRLKKTALKSKSKTLGKKSLKKKTLRKKMKKVKKGGMPARYYGMPVEKNMLTKANTTTACKLPKNTTGNCLGPVPKS